MHLAVQDAVTSARNPLQFNLVGQSYALLLKIGPSIQNAQDRQHLEGILSQPPTCSVSQALGAASNLLAVPAFTLLVADTFRPLLIDLCARWLENSELDEVDRFVALCLLVEPYEEIFPILTAYLRHESLTNGPLAFTTQTGLVLSDVPVLHLQRILLAYYRLLIADPETPTRLGWSTSLLQSIYRPASSAHPDGAVRWLALRCLGLQTHLPEATREKLEIEFVGSYDTNPLDLCAGQELYSDRSTNSEVLKIRDVIVDAWIFPALDLRRIQAKREELVTQSGHHFFQPADSIAQLTQGDFHPQIVNVAGILLYSGFANSNRQGSADYVPTTTTTNTLRALALHISQRVPILLTAMPASGKMTLLRELANRIHPEGERSLVILQLADTALDAKSLIGSYVSAAATEGSTGGFEWRDGAVPRALRAGKWLVLADVDRASTEVLATLLPLVESMRLGKFIGELPSMDLGGGRGRVEANQNFMLFGMRSVTKVDMDKPRVYALPTFFGHKHWFEVQLSPPSADELVMIVERRFAKLGPAVSRAAVEFWREMGIVAKGLAKGRDVGMRDLEKFCARLEKSLPLPAPESPTPSLTHLFPNHLVRQEILLEAKDVFFAAYEVGTPRFISIAARAAQLLGLDEERTDWVLVKRTPEYQTRKSGVVSIGRAQLQPKHLPSGAPSATSSKPFALHRPALTLLESLAASIDTRESILLVGETGTGKTTAVQHAAQLSGTPLVVLNLSNQSEASDLLGGFRPVDARVPAGRLQETFVELFGASFSRKKNQAFEDAVRAAYVGGKWARTVKLWREAGKMAGVESGRGTGEGEGEGEGGAEGPRKRRKVSPEWEAFMHSVDEFDASHVRGQSKFVFSFVEGPLVTALRNGHWVLLDEVNLASAETLECVASILQGPRGSVTLTEAGHLEPIPRHPDFRLFACMNPATDAGKKDLPPNIRSRFTEFYVPPPDADEDALRSMVAQYIGHCDLSDKAAISDAADFYIAAKRLTATRQLADGQNHVPHFSMRTLARALTFASDLTPTLKLRRALWEGVTMAFMMTLDTKSVGILRAAAERHVLRDIKNLPALLGRSVPPPEKDAADKYIQIGPFWLLRGPEPVQSTDEYILTPSVEAKLVDLARIVTTRRFPVLIEGPTSSGKTSSVEYLAKQTGHRFVRINNHEHTDLQEYLGSYLTDPATGKLKFQDGILVRALRAGDWIVLDELNLAPTDVLEALNRLLDDNRELVVPETNEVIRPHPNFMLFATQNPPGLYAGRKVLSRAFRNRFLEVHFDDVPQAELETILCRRCGIAESHGRKIVAVFQELQKRRQVERVFETKNSFATLRDLFRWANRHSAGYVADAAGGNYQHLAEQGFMLLAERARRPDDRAVVKGVIEDVMKVKIDERALYELTSPSAQGRIGISVPPASGVVWTGAMRRLFTLVATALRYNEPVLLVGETGSGKTSVCELVALALGRPLHTLSCHQNTETADLLGSQRPLRNRTALREATVSEATRLLKEAGCPPPDVAAGDFDQIVRLIESALKTCLPEHTAPLRHVLLALRRSMALFEWHDGPLIKAMQEGGLFLLDEISLADDSVLERLNSVLEPSRSVVLAEKGGNDISHLTVVAAPEFELVATMNPGGDYGKKELSPALRNRFTEIWVPHVEERDDLAQIIHHSWKDERLCHYTPRLLDFAEYVGRTLKDKNILGLRDLLAWVSFSNFCASNTTLSLDLVFHHAARLTVLDGVATLGTVASLPLYDIEKIAQTLKQKLEELVPLSHEDLLALGMLEVAVLDTRLWIGSFSVELGDLPSANNGFSLQAPTTRMNAARVVRALQIPKPLLLEGSPGVGKTSLIVALAAMSGHALCRINLSDQTDLIDLFGSDMPVEGGNPGEFAWRDAAFLRAMRNGDWVLLDEMNLAPQAVLEGLNAVLDHRGTVFIPELGREFAKHPNFRVFAAQNPLGQGGGRKGLPKSFVNRFTKVYVEALSRDDLQVICSLVDPEMEHEDLLQMLTFNERLCGEVVDRARFGREGGPWEFNLRDILRWMSLWKSTGLPSSCSPAEYLGDAYIARFRSRSDQLSANALYTPTAVTSTSFRKIVSVGLEHVQFGHTLSDRKLSPVPVPSLALLRDQSMDLEVASKCIDRGWLLILNGPSYSGKTSLIRTLATLQAQALREICVSAGTDTTDLLGGFEHSNQDLKLAQLVSQLKAHVGRTFSVSGVLNAELDTLVRSLVDASASSSLNQAKRPVDLLETIRYTLRNSPELDSTDIIAAIGDFLQTIPSSSGHFEWVDGPLVQAMKEGSWIVLDHCNLCSPAVLDRLNSLCETGGVLVLSERGTIDGEIPVIVPHPNFRLFMLLNSNYGELSRAMRNRGVEISISPIEHPTDIIRIRQAARLPRTPREEQDMAFDDGITAQLSRRGLIENDRPSAHSAFAPLANLVLAASDHKAFGSISVLGILDSLPAMNESSQHWASTLLFLATSIPQESFRALPRYLQAFGYLLSSDTWPAFVDYAASESCNSLRARTGNQRGVSSRFLSSQPVLLHLNTNIVSPAFVPEAYTESVIAESCWEAIVRGLLTSPIYPLTSVSTSGPLSIMDKSRLIWGGVGAGITAPRCVKSIAPLVSSLHKASTLAMASPGGFKSQLAVNSIHQLCDYAEILRNVSETPYVDFSAIRALAQLVAATFDEPEFPREYFGDAMTLTHDLLQDTAIRSGQAMLQLWSTMRLPTLAEASQNTLSRLFGGLNQLSRTHQDARKESLDVAALLHLKESAELVECATRLSSIGTNEAFDSRFSNIDRQELCVLTLDMIANALAHASPTQTNDMFLSVVCCIPRTELRSYVFLRMLMWEADLSKASRIHATLPSALDTLSPSLNGLSTQSRFGSLIRWIQTCWSPSEDRETASGPQSILGSVEHPACLKRCDVSLIQLGQYREHEETLRTQGAHLKLQAYLAGNQRLVSLAIMWIHSISLVLIAFHSEATAEEQAHTLGIQTRLSQVRDKRSACVSVAEMIELLEGCSVPLLADAAKVHLTKLRDIALSVPADDSEFAMFLGQAWISAAYMLLELYFPDIPMDPLGGQTSRSAVWRLRAEWLQTYMHTLSLGQDLVQGASYDPFLGRLRDQLSAVQARYDSLKPTVVRGPEHLRQLTEMFTESHAFLTQAIGIQRISNLVQTIQVEPQANVFAQEEMVQGTIATFLHRLHEGYPDIADIILPLDYALHQLKLGLRIYASAAQRTGNHAVASRVAQLLLDRPSVLGCYRLLEFDLTTLISAVPSSASTAEWIVTKISALLLSQEVERSSRLDLPRLVELYDQFLHLWLAQKAREARAEEEGKSLYRSSKIESEGSSEEAELEKEFNDLFPSYDDVLDNLDTVPVHRSEVVRSATSLNSADVRTIHRLHASWAILASGAHPASPSLGEMYSQGSAAILAHIVRDYESSLDASIDSAGLPQRIHTLQSSLRRLAPRTTSSFDFYHDPNILELGRAARLLDALRSRLDGLITEWPDQMVLRHLYERTQTISQLRLDTPIAKVLSALEQLLLHTDDWETYANKENTLKLQQKELADLIVDWRRLELKCWSTLLDREMASCVECVSIWWPQLYESVVNAVTSTEGDSEKLVAHLQQLIPLLDSYLTRSPLGQFEPRLSLLRSFAKLTRSLSAEAGTSSFSSVSDILDTLSLQYFELLPSVKNSLAKQRAGVDKEIGDFIKLASWKDTNVHALKQSAQKTHRVLHKCIRKFRAIIRQPVSEVLTSQPLTDGFTTDGPQETISPSASTTPVIIRREAASSSPLHNINIQLALQKYQSHATRSGHQLVRIEGTHATHSLAARIVAESKELAESPIPDSEARERHIKALISRKRRAWSDLLKELKRLGLSVAVTTEVLSQQEDRARLLSLSLDADTDFAFSNAVAAVNRQYIKLLEIMPDMRTSFRQHHSDISTRDFRRASSFVESSFSIAIESRKTLRVSLTAYNRVSARLGRIADIRDQMNAGGSILGIGEEFQRSVQSTRAIVGRVRHTLAELADEVASFEEVTGESNISPATKEALRRGADRGEEILTAMSGIEKRCSLLSTPIWTQAETAVLDQARTFVSDIKSTFESISSDPTVPVRLFQPVHAWLKSIETPSQPRFVSREVNEMPPLADGIISKLLVSMQAIVASQNTPPGDVSDDEIPDKAIRTAAQHVQKVTLALALEEIDRSFAALTDNMAHMDEDQIVYSIDRLVPFLQPYLELVHQSLSETISWLGSISRLTYVLAATVRTLMQKGFCKPPDVQDEPESSKGGQDLAEGTGMGEGAGAENISNQIEDEAQVEGLQGEEESKEKGDKNEDENEAIEMSEDFAGEMEDVSDGEDGEEESKSGSEADPEERIDDLDSTDPGVVDEKLWNDESAEDKPEGQDQAGDDSTTQPGEKSETAAKDDKPQKSTDQRREGDPSTDDVSLGSEIGSAEDEQQGMEEEENDQAPEDGRKLDDFVPEANTLDLPEDLDLAPNDEAAEASEEEDDEGGVDNEDVVMEDGGSVDEREKTEEPESPAELNSDTMAIGEPDAADKNDVPEDEQERAEAGIGPQDAGAGNQDGVDAPESGDQAGQQAGGTQNEGRDGGGDGDENSLEERHAPEIDHKNAAGRDELQDNAEGDSGTRARASGASHQQEQQSSGQELPNPLRSLGDASKEIQRRVDQILNRKDIPQPAEQPVPGENPAEVEYAQDDDADLDMQALGPSNDSDEATKLRDLRINDVAAPPPEEVAADMVMQLDHAPPNTSPAEAKQSEARTSSLEAALTADDILQSRGQREQDPNIEMSNTEPNAKHEDELVDVTPPVDSDKLEAVVAEWQTQGHPIEGAEEIWRLYESLTQDLSHALCEQLRLILAPTRATRLRGDFRTGKRLNMKKLVPYVASDFTRDKIWLRRTRPAAREYQVLLAVDDSRSMARASHTIHLTRQALALVARALEKLEVGELALARFGREVEVVHEFGAGVLHGGAALGRFTFDQPATDVLRLLESSLEVLRSARERGSGSSDLWQLEIIISDGICQDHERLRTILRRAEEERVMIVFVVVDAPAQNGPEDNSIVSMLQPTIKTVNGRMDIQMERYLDSFPFRYFVVLRDVEALPAVLAGTLRQFFERISED